MITIKLNGKETIIDKEMSITEFLSKKEIKKESVVVLIDEDVIKKDRFDERKIKDGDKVEILRFVSGG